MYGVIVHGYFAACYVLDSHLPRGTNVTIECLHRTFLKLCSQGKKFLRRLNISLDNTSNDNKSWFVVAYLCMLVCCGYFDGIAVCLFFWSCTYPFRWLPTFFHIFHLRDKDIWNFDMLCHHLLNSCSLIEFVEMIDSLVPLKEYYLPSKAWPPEYTMLYYTIRTCL